MREQVGSVRTSIQGHLDWAAAIAHLAGIGAEMDHLSEQQRNRVIADATSIGRKKSRARALVRLQAGLAAMRWQ